MSDERKCVVAVCVCGGWVMLAVLGVSKQSDRDTWREVSKLAREGFEIRTPLTPAECRTLDGCEHRGDCTTSPEKVRAQQTEVSL
jgi:predicted CoA-binding protein